MQNIKRVIQKIFYTISSWSIKRKIFFLILSFFIFLASYILFLLSDPRLQLVNPTQESEGENETASVCLQRGSIVYKEDLHNYFLLTHHFEHFQSWLSEKIASGEISTIYRQREELYLAQNVCLNDLIRNDCKERYCLQHKIPFEELPPILWKGLIGIEDYRFLKHIGVDWTSILRALWADLRAMKLVQGGSTLTQQLVKNLFLTNEKSFFRKFKEMIYAFYLEARYEKEDILTAYFNEVYWGGGAGIFVRGIYGASFFYFGKRPEDLTDFETLILIGILKGPQFYGPSSKLQRPKERTLFVLQKLLERNLIAPEIKSEAWSDVRWKEWQRWFNIYRKNQNLKSLWYISTHTSERKDLGLSLFDQLVLIQSFQRVQELLKSHIENKDLAFKVLIGNPFQIEQPPFTFYSKWERDQERSFSDEYHQVGSLLKPLFYAIYQKKGFHFDHRITTAPLTLKLPAGKWTPREAHSLSIHEVTLREALQKSLNGPTVRMAQQVGFDVMESEILPYIPQLKTPLKHYPAQILGSIEMSLNDLYHLFAKLVQEECRMTHEGKETVLQVLSLPELSTTATVLDSRLRGVRFFGKTGTSNQGFDNWYVAFDGKLLYLFWFGFEGNRTQGPLSLYGSTSAFRIFQDFLIHRGQLYSEFHCPKH